MPDLCDKAAFQAHKTTTERYPTYTSIYIYISQLLLFVLLLQIIRALYAEKKRCIEVPTVYACMYILYFVLHYWFSLGSILMQQKLNEKMRQKSTQFKENSMDTIGVYVCVCVCILSRYYVHYYVLLFRINTNIGKCF